MRVRTICLTLGLATPALFGCGDDVAATPDAKVTPDSPVTPDAPLPPVFKGFDADDGVSIVYDDVGPRDGPAVVLCHGLAAAGRQTTRMRRTTFA